MIHSPDIHCSLFPSIVDPDPAFQVNPDPAMDLVPNPDPGFLWPKIGKNEAENFGYQFTYP